MNTVILILLAFQILHFVCTWKLYVLAGKSAWQAAIPLYSAFVLMKIIDRPWWWAVLLYIPVVGNVMVFVVWNDTSRCFGYRNFFKGLIAIFSFGLSLGYISYFGSPVYNDKYKQSRSALDSSLVGALVFACVAASLLKTATYEAYTIPTSSMEGSMLVGDFLFVNKMVYGNRIAMTPFSVPLVHDSIPFTKIKSYIPEVRLPYMRLPRFASIKRNDIVVFNYPVDSLANKPIDKKSNYIKRCVAIAGDTLQIVSSELFVNGQTQKWSERDRPQWLYKLYSPSTFIRALNATGYELAGIYYQEIEGVNNEVVMAFLSEDKLAKFLASAPYVKAEKQISSPEEPDKSIFPLGSSYNVDNYGPLVVPKAGEVVTINDSTLSTYQTIIEYYEGNTLEKKSDGIYINGQKADSYTIKQDYYFMMGDNRHNSLDSRFWGFVPEDHIVGRPALIWFSLSSDDGKTPFFKRIRVERLLTAPMGEGEAKSYLIPVLVGGLVLYGGYKFYTRRKKAKKKINK